MGTLVGTDMYVPTVPRYLNSSVKFIYNTSLQTVQVAFIGISNWALDPAKMNRGILLSRGVPSKEDLNTSAVGICSGNEDASRLMRATTKLLAEGYSQVYERQEREYFGLRDYYSLVKMVYAMVEKNRREPSREDITYAVQRNFGGYFGHFRPTKVFLSAIYGDVTEEDLKPAKALVMEAVRQEEEMRYILLLTKNNVALSIIQEQVGF